MPHDYNFSNSELEFLTAQTDLDDGGSTDWDSYINNSSATFESRGTASYILRPETSAQITDISAHLIKAFTTPATYMKFLNHRGDSAQDLLDLLQKLLDHASLKPQFRVLLYVALVRLCRKSERCPRSFYLQGVSGKEERPRTDGRFGDIYKAYYKGKDVCLKVVKLYRNSNQSELYKMFSREAVVWAQLLHPNILPFYGIYFLNDASFCLVSPWIRKGNVYEFLNKKPDAHRPRLIYGVAAGMEYLHKNGVVHGDLKPLNILVAEPEQVLLTDFGFSYVTDDNGLQGPPFSSSHFLGFTREFEAPERLEDPQRRRTRASDVFAFGMSCYELFTYPNLPNAKTISISAAHSRIAYIAPSLGRFTEYRARGLTNEMWQVIESCWSHNPNVRPTAITITGVLSKLSSIETRYLSNEWSLPSRPGFESSRGHVDYTIERALPLLQAL